MYDGYTALDLNELAQTSDYNSLNPGTMATFLDYKYATPDIVYKANSQVDAMITDMRQSDPYKAAVKELEVVRGKEISIGKHTHVNSMRLTLKLPVISLLRCIVLLLVL
jgi:hypothetical protein